MNDNDIVLTGVPRGGTTLACSLLQQCRDTVALFEPIAVADLASGDRIAALDQVSSFFAHSRERALRDGVVASQQVRGRVPDNPFASELDADGRRRLLATPGELRLDPIPSPAFTLVVKHNALFTALLPELHTRFRTLAIVRHPLSVLASWNSLDLPVSDGWLPMGERFDATLGAELHGQPDRLTRQLAILDWFFSRFETLLPAADVLRYEDIVSSQGAALLERAGVAGPSISGLSVRNDNPLYPRQEIPRLARALETRPGSWQRWYPIESIATVAASMRPPGTGN